MAWYVHERELEEKRRGGELLSLGIISKKCVLYVCRPVNFSPLLRYEKSDAMYTSICRCAKFKSKRQQKKDNE